MEPIVQVITKNVQLKPLRIIGALVHVVHTVQQQELIQNTGMMGQIQLLIIKILV